MHESFATPHPPLGHRAPALLALLALLLASALAGPSRSDLYAAAAAARASWRYDRALALYAEAAQGAPGDPRPHCLTGEVLALQERYAEATAAYERCQTLGATGPDTWLALGNIAQEQGDVAGAESAWLRAAAAGSATAHQQLGQLYESQGRFDEAETQWRAVAASQAEAQVHLGLLALRVGDFAAARSAFVAARELPGVAGQDAVDEGFVALAALAPTDVIGLTSLGVAFVQANLPTFASLPLEQALALDPHYGPAHAYLGWVEWLAGERTASLTDIASARAAIPTDPFTLYVAAEQQIAAGQWTQAQAGLTLALKHDQANPALWAALGRAYLGTVDYVQAELSYETAAQLAPEPAYTELFLQFYLDHRLGLTDGRAVLAASRAVARWPQLEPVQELAAKINQLAGLPTEALIGFQRANQLDPSDPEPYYYLGQMAFLGGEYDAATLDLRTVVALRPDSALAQSARSLLAPLAGLTL